jgi:uncharacterized RDD family membrane protein YckC
MDRPLDLDRRIRERDPAGPGTDGTGGITPPFDPDRSDWKLGAPLDETADGIGERAVEGTRADGARPAPALRRAAAWAIDGALVAVALAGLPAALLASTGAFGAAGSLGEVLAAGLPVIVPTVAFVGVAALVYVTVAHALAGATLGKRFVRIRVVDLDGRVPGFARSAARSAWAVLSLALLGIGFLPALFAPSGRALHDLLAGTRVVEAP